MSSVQFHNYLMFDGQCKEALEFYAKAFEAKLEISYFADAPMDGMQDIDKNRVMHGGIAIGDTPLLMASDTFPGSPEKLNPGNNYAVSVNAHDVSELEKRFSALSEGANVTMPLAETFWAVRFGQLTDKFGVRWMFNCPNTSSKPTPSNN